MDLDYKIVYSNRKTISLIVERDRSVVVHAPEGYVGGTDTSGN